MTPWFPEEVLEALQVLPEEPEDIATLMDIALMEVAPHLVGVAQWYPHPDGETAALGVPGTVPDEDALVILQAYRVAGGAHGCCKACFLAGRGPLCAAGECAS